MSVIPRVYVDWDDDNTFDDAEENISPRVFARPGVSAVRGRDQVRALTPPAAGSFHTEVDNSSRDYSPENPDSPIAATLQPGHKVRSTVFIGTEYLYDDDIDYDSDAYYDGAPAYHISTTLLDDLPQHPALGNETVEMPGIGVFSRLVGKRVTTPLYQNILISDAIGYVLDAVGWPADERRISPSTTMLEWWWLDDASAWEAVQALFFSEGPGATMYEGADGYFVFEDRTYRLTETRCTDSQMTLAAMNTVPPISAMKYQSGIKDIINVCSAPYIKREAASLAPVWTLGTTLTLAAGESRSFVARSDTGDPYVNAVAPAAGTDYTVSVGSIASTSINRTSGAQVRVTITAGGGGATVTMLQLRAELVTVTASGSIESTVDADDSIARYGRRTFSYETLPHVPLNVLQDLVNAIVATYSVPQPIIEVTVIGHDDASAMAILAREISDRISVADPTSGFASDVFIEQIEVKATDAGLIAVKFGCSKSDATGYGIWDTSLWDTGRWAY